MTRGLYSNNFNCNPVPVVLKLKKRQQPLLKIAIIWAQPQHAQKRVQCMNGPYAERKTNFCAETIN